MTTVVPTTYGITYRGSGKTKTIVPRHGRPVGQGGVFANDHGGYEVITQYRNIDGSAGRLYDYTNDLQEAEKLRERQESTLRVMVHNGEARAPQRRWTLQEGAQYAGLSMDAATALANTGVINTVEVENHKFVSTNEVVKMMSLTKKNFKPIQTIQQTPVVDHYSATIAVAADIISELMARFK